MRKVLKEIRGKFILSINDHPRMREVFDDFFIKPVDLNYSVGPNEKTGYELLISNMVMQE